MTKLVISVKKTVTESFLIEREKYSWPEGRTNSDLTAHLIVFNKSAFLQNNTHLYTALYIIYYDILLII